MIEHSPKILASEEKATTTTTTNAVDGCQRDVCLNVLYRINTP